MSYKQVILCRIDLKMSKGKLAAQVSHASLHAALEADKKILDSWLKEGATKVVLKVKDEKELIAYKKKVGKLPHSLIMDAGRTFFKEPTRTCLAIGPAKESDVDKITGKLKLL
ncbi:MAG: peptidyl-tRNA hydrolase Pth2 [Candidatus Nanoarchaeia archaeon]|nr:peptidyl-tRNA hydrolase Pth2 [Candidatus Nanoarchaeia archaeon]